jgi:uncharacterized protein (DUF2249 family)
MADSQLTDRELDVRPLAKPDKHPTIFAAYSELAVGGSFVLVNDHDPQQLPGEFQIEHPQASTGSTSRASQGTARPDHQTETDLDFAPPRPALPTRFDEDDNATAVASTRARSPAR